MTDVRGTIHKCKLIVSVSDSVVPNYSWIDYSLFYGRCVCVDDRKCVRAEENASDVHTIPDVGVGERISLQPIFDTSSAH